jgi:addiction module HigA family antidote
MSKSRITTEKLPPIHPGEALADALREAGISASSAAIAMGLPPSTLTRIIKGQRNVTAPIALRIARYFGNLAGHLDRNSDRLRSCNSKGPRGCENRTRSSPAWSICLDPRLGRRLSSIHSRRNAHLPNEPMRQVALRRKARCECHVYHG